MRIIKGHKSRSFDEIVKILSERGTFTFPRLPHYRYKRTQEICSRLIRLGLAVISGRDGVNINIISSALFLQWKRAKEEGVTDKGPVKYVKELYVNCVNGE